MARPEAFTKSFPTTISQDKAAFVIFFEQVLVGFATRAAKEVGGLQGDGGGKFFLKLEERFSSDSLKPHRFYRAVVGSSIERKVYEILKDVGSATKLTAGDTTAGVYQAKVGGLDGVESIVFALEYTGEFTHGGVKYFRSSFSNSRPDIRLAIPGNDGNYYEAIFDLTSEGGVGHILKKKDNWLAKPAVAYVSEIVWEDDDIMHKGNAQAAQDESVSMEE